jgi:nucleoside-diphosphate-sugar epimerase
MKKILVTGSAGFIASHLIEELLKDQNNCIIGIDNFYSGTKENLEFIKSIDKENRFQIYKLIIILNKQFYKINKK